jgi:putative DNA primase/helicase
MKSMSKMSYEELKRLEEEAAVMMRVHKLRNGLLQNTDTRNAERLIAKYGTDIRYNGEWKKWLVWNGKYWRTDTSGCYVHEKGLLMVRAIYDELIGLADWRDRVELEKFAIQSESWNRRKAFVEAASAIQALNITSEDLDPDPWLLNVENGTLNLVTGEFSEHRQTDMITKIAPVAYVPGADCPNWKQFVCEIMDFNTDLISFLQTAAGWGVTGDTSEQVMFIMFGSGANGKSTFLNTIMQILGEYATATPTETFMKQTGDKISNDLARLRGSRFVTTTEAEQGKKLAEPLIKQITGNDKITARFLRFFEEFLKILQNFRGF